jgi:hypothetical protein
MKQWSDKNIHNIWMQKIPMDRKLGILLYAIIDNLIIRQPVSQTLKKWNFLAYWIVRNLMDTNRKYDFRDDRVWELRRQLESDLLKKELIVLYGSEELKGTPPYEVLQWLHGSNMATTSEQTCKLAEIISTIPATTASAERSFSAFSRIKTYFRTTQSQDRVNCHSCQ